MALAILGICPDCSEGELPYNGDWGDPEAHRVSCTRCDGTGDPLGALLARAYRCGREDAIDEVRRGLAHVGEMIGEPMPRHVQARGLRSRVGAR